MNEQQELFEAVDPRRMFANVDGGQEPAFVRARQELIERARDGVSCPCCGQFVKLYRMPFRWSAAYALVHLVRDLRGRVLNTFIHLPSFLQKLPMDDARAKAALCGGGGPVVFLVPWGLIERQPGERDDGSWRTGYYRPTLRGVKFANGTITVPKYFYSYDGRALGFEGPDITIHEALGQKFNHDEIMRG